MQKSSRHSKITGDFAERLVLYWLSKHGFECAYVDHVGVDIIARNPHTLVLMGISVKSRSRNPGTEQEALNIPTDNLTKLGSACEHFGCAPFFAIVVDAGPSIEVFIMSADCLEKHAPRGKVNCSWKMTPKARAAYGVDPEIKRFSLATQTTNWWNENMARKHRP